MKSSYVQGLVESIKSRHPLQNSENIKKSDRKIGKLNE